MNHIFLLLTRLKTAHNPALFSTGVLVMLADFDAGNVVVAAQGGARWGYTLLPVLTLMIPLLYFVQNLSAQVGMKTGKGFGKLVREKFGRKGAFLFALAITFTAIATLITEYSGVASAGVIFGVPKSISILLAMFLTVSATISRRLQNAWWPLIVIVAGCQASFFLIACLSHPNLEVVAKSFTRLPIGDTELYILIAATIGVTFNPWMLVYQQAAASNSRITKDNDKLARLGTASGAVITQIFTMAIVIAVVNGSAGTQRPTFEKISDIAVIFIHYMGDFSGALLFACGIIAASMLAALVCAGAMADGIAEIISNRAGAPSKNKLSTGTLVTVGAIFISAFCSYIFDDGLNNNVLVQSLSGVITASVIFVFFYISNDVLRNKRKDENLSKQARCEISGDTSHGGCHAEAPDGTAPY